MGWGLGGQGQTLMRDPLLLPLQQFCMAPDAVSRHSLQEDTCGGLISGPDQGALPSSPCKIQFNSLECLQVSEHRSVFHTRVVPTAPGGSATPPRCPRQELHPSSFLLLHLLPNLATSNSLGGLPSILVPGMCVGLLFQFALLSLCLEYSSWLSLPSYYLLIHQR